MFFLAQGALAQSAPSSVSVDWSALDALGSAPSAAAPAVVLHAPPKPPVMAARPPAAAPKPPAPAPLASGALASVAPAPVPSAPPPPAPTPAPPRAAAAAPAPAPAPAAAPAAPKVALAGAPASVPAPMPGRTTMVRFVKDQSDIPAQGRGALDAVAAQLAADAKLRLQLVAHASGTGDDAVEARRLSLARAVKMRSYLIEKGVQSIRMDVRAFGSRDVGDGPADRVDLVIVDH
ncbi:MAG TPA: OmpA family protein [Stellaceae bacterium]|nr:OmpA family protein [Stellaceae bacterium]